MYIMAKNYFTGNSACSENCLKFKMPKVPKIEVFCRFYLNFACEVIFFSTNRIPTRFQNVRVFINRRSEESPQF